MEEVPVTLKAVEKLVPKDEAQNQKMAEKLRHLADRAERGDLCGIMIAYEFKDGTGYGYMATGLSFEQRLALMERTKWRTMKEWDIL